MSGSRSRRKHDPLPKPPIAAVLKEITGVDVPYGSGWVRCSCPFHDDRTPSAAVNHEIDGFTCHSCGRRGDALKLLQRELGLTFREARERASVLSGEPSNGQPRTRRRRPSDLLRGPE